MICSDENDVLREYSAGSIYDMPASEDANERLIFIKRIYTRFIVG